MAPNRLTVLIAFVRTEDGELVPAFDAREMQSEDRARSEARNMAGSGKYAGVIAWSREAHPDVGDYGPPEVLFQHGEVPDLE
jgi:hypothetical protein